MQPAGRRRLFTAVAALLAVGLFGLGMARRYLYRTVEAKLARIEKRLAPALAVTHGAIDISLLRRRLTVRDLVLEASGRGTLRIDRLIVNDVDRAHARPRFLDLSMEGLQATVPEAGVSELAEGLGALGFTQLTGRGRIAYRWDAEASTLAVEELRLEIPEAGDIRITAQFGGFDPERLQAGEPRGLTIEALDVDYRDHSFLRRLADLLRAEEPALGQELAAGLEQIVGGLGESAGRPGRETAVRRFLAAPDELHAQLRVSAPVAIEELASEHLLSRVLARFPLELEVSSRATATDGGHPVPTGRVFDRITAYEPSEATTIRTADGQLLGHLGEERRFLADSALPLHLSRAFLAAEDSAFHEHEGIDPSGIFRAVFRNARAGSAVEGGSTITQQLIKRLLVGSDKSIGRKLKEATLALRLEKVLSKAEILRVYLDHIYFGAGAYGIEAAARTYFAKPAARLSVAEAALVAGLPRAPTAYNPYRAPEAARTRQRYVLGRMRELGWLSPSEHEWARAAKLIYRPDEEGVWTAGAWYMEEVRRWLVDHFPGVTGLEVRAGIDLMHQAAAEEAVSAGLEEARERIAVYGPSLQAALVSLDPRTGEILALVGGEDFQTSQFNRATQARRQAGSAFKPFVFSAALDAGYTLASVLEDGPWAFEDPITHVLWEPANFADEYHGKVLLRTALVKSLNLATVRLAADIGIDKVQERARAMGVDGELPPYLSISLGSAEVSLLGLCRAYTTLARGGSWIEPQLVLSVRDRAGEELYRAEPRVTQATSAANAFLVTSALKDVIRSGTATVCRELDRPAAGKTGTSNEARDGWFIGYTPYLVTGVWVGFDDGTAMGDEGVGGRVAAPIWLRYRQAVEDQYPVEDFTAPPGIVFRSVSAAELGATGEGDAVYQLPFLAGSEPMLDVPDDDR